MNAVINMLIIDQIIAIKSPCEIHVANRKIKDLASLNANLKENAQMSDAELHKKLEDAFSEISRQKGVLQTQEATITKVERQNAVLIAEKSTDASEIKTLKRGNIDVTESRDNYKQQAEEAKAKLEALDGKYRELLRKDLALNEKLTETNEKIVEMYKQLDQKEALIRKQKSLDFHRGIHRFQMSVPLK